MNPTAPCTPFSETISPLVIHDSVSRNDSINKKIEGVRIPLFTLYASECYDTHISDIIESFDGAGRIQRLNMSATELHLSHLLNHFSKPNTQKHRNQYLRNYFVTASPANQSRAAYAALMGAASENLPDLLEELLKREEIKRSDFSGAICIASAKGHVRILAKLLPFRKKGDLGLALESAAEQNQLESLKILLQYRDEIPISNFERACKIAVFDGEPQVLEILDPQDLGNLFVEASENHIEAINLLLKHSLNKISKPSFEKALIRAVTADSNAHYWEGMGSSSWLACDRQHVKQRNVPMVKRLLQFPDKISPECFKTAFAIALFNYHIAIAELLVDKISEKNFPLIREKADLLKVDIQDFLSRVTLPESPTFRSLKQFLL